MFRSLFFRLPVVGVLVLLAGPVAAETYYNSQMMSMEQKEIMSPLPGNNKRVLEGCGPISAAMLLGYWQTEKGKANLLANGFNGHSHPDKAIRKLYRKLKTKKAPGANNLQSYTLAKNYYKGLQDWVKGRGLEVKRVRRVNTWAAKKSALKSQLQQGHPVVLLKWKEHKDGCLGEGTRGFNLYKNIEQSHYFVAVGYRNNKVAIMPGGFEVGKTLASDFSVHLARNQTEEWEPFAFTTCTFDEIKKTSPTLFWLEPKN